MNRAAIHASLLSPHRRMVCSFLDSSCFVLSKTSRSLVHTNRFYSEKSEDQWIRLHKSCSTMWQLPLEFIDVIQS